MGWRSKVAAALASLSAIGTGGAAVADEGPDFVSAWTGFDGSLVSHYGYAGAAYAFGNDIDSDGVIARIGFGGGQYRTDGANSHLVDHYNLDLMLGYHFNIDGAVIALYAGGDINFHNNDDPSTDIRGLEPGAKAQIEAYAPLSEWLFFAAFANYSTAFNTFDASAKLAYRINDSFSIGPETAVLGCEGFNQVRAGIASAWRIGNATELAPSVGAAWRLAEDDYGLYAAINLYTRF